VRKTLALCAALCLLLSLAAPALAATGELIPTVEARLPGYKHKSAEGLVAAIEAAGSPANCDLRPAVIPAEDLIAAHALAPETDIFCRTEFAGVTIDTGAVELDLNEVFIADADGLARLLACFPCLSRVEMCNCGLTNEEMAALGRKLPDVRFVWEIRVGKWRMRTDITAFSTLNTLDARRYYSHDFAALRYCTDLRALDLGHNEISDISWLESLTELRILILADNDISDLTPLAKLTKLEYAELFINRISDLSPLSGLENLMDLNICYCRVNDLTPLHGLTRLERFWCSHNKIAEGGVEALQKALPDCHIDTTSYQSTGNGWRVHQRYYVLYEIFHTRVFLPWDADVPVVES